MSEPQQEPKQATQLAEVGEIFQRILGVLERIHNTVSEQRPDVARALEAAGHDVQVIEAAMQQTLDMLASVMAMADEARLQRDDALVQLKFERRRNGASYLRDLARFVAFDAGVSFKDVERVFDVLGGQKDLWMDEELREAFLESLGELAKQLYMEDELQAALETMDSEGES